MTEEMERKYLVGAKAVSLLQSLLIFRAINLPGLERMARDLVREYDGIADETKEPA